MRRYGLFIHGQYVHTGNLRSLRSPLKPEQDYAQIAWLTNQEEHQETIDAALQGCLETEQQIRADFFPLAERLEFLQRLHKKISEASEALAQTICLEVAKPITLARLEVQRSLSTLEWTIHEAKHYFNTRGLPSGTKNSWKGLKGYVNREPRGTLLAITPFNFPLNLVMHKLAPALAAGCPVILKPSPKAAVIALTLADLCQSAELPAGLLCVLNCEDSVTEKLCQDSRIKHISFTGSSTVGWDLQTKAPNKPWHLELGGFAPAYVHADADLDHAAKKLATAAFSYAGQICISTQNIFAHSSIADAFLQKFKEQVDLIPWGHPEHESVICGPMISSASITALKTKMESALSQGATILHESSQAPLGLTLEEAQKSGLWIKPTVLTNVPKNHALACEEAFGPVVNFQTVNAPDEFEQRVNAYTHRLQAGVFTESMTLATNMQRRLDFGSVIINEGTALRLEPMPYGGRGLAGNTAEGPLSALENYTQHKTTVIRVLS